MCDLILGVGLEGQLGKLSWWDVAPAVENMIQALVLARLSIGAPPIVECIYWFWKVVDRTGPD